MSGQQDDILIAVIGSVGTGKSSFTNLLWSDAGVNDIDSETSDVRVASFRDSECGRNVTIADCPGFDDPRVSDTEVLKKIADFLLKEYDDKRQLNGLIYLQQISNTSFGGQSMRNLAMFRNLCGKKAYKNVVILTIFWDQFASEQGKKWEERLKVTFKELLEGGACFMRHNRTIESARGILQYILTLDPTNVHIQEEIRLEGKAFEETAAGSMRREEVDRIIAKHSKEMTELRNELEMMKNRGDDASRQRLEEEQAKLQTELKRWEDEKAGLMKERDEAIEAQKHIERWRQDQQREWEFKFDDQEKKAREMSETIIKSVEEVTKLKNELETSTETNSVLSQVLNEERTRLQTELQRWKDEQAELTKDRDEAKEAQKRMEADNEKRHRDQQREWESMFENQEKKAREMSETIASSEGEMTNLRDELETTTKRISALSQELEEDRVKLQTGFKQWEGERSELKKNLAEANEAQKQTKADRVKERADNEAWRKDQECEWETRLNAQGKEYAKLMQALQSQVDQEQKARAEADKEHERQRQEAATNEASRREQERKDNEQWRRDQEHKWESRLGAKGKEHTKSIQALQSQLDQERQAHADADKEYERQLQEAATNEAARREQERKNNEQWRRDQECEWESRLDAQGKEHAKLMQVLRSQLDQEKNARADADKECERQLQKAATSEAARREQEQWRKEQEHKWESRLDAQRKEHAKSMQALRSQLDQEKQARAGGDKEYERQLQEAATSEAARREHERKNNEQWRKEQEHKWEFQLNAQREEHAKSMQALQSQLDQEKQARADADREHETQLQEREQERENNERWHKDQECEWKSHFDAHEKRAQENIAKHTRGMVEVRDELEMAKNGNNALSQELDEERARLQRESARWEIERVELKKRLSDAEDAQERLKGAVREWADHEKRRQDQEREWQSRFDDQEKKAREISEMIAKSKETKNELETTKNGNSVLAHELEEERTRLQGALARWVEERAELKRCLDEARKSQMRVEEDVAKERVDREKMHREKIERIIAKHEEEMAGFGYEYDMMRRSNEALRNEYEEEWARSQLRLARWEAEKAELKKGLDEATKAQRRVEDPAKERERHNQEYAWRSPRAQLGMCRQLRVD